MEILSSNAGMVLKLILASVWLDSRLETDEGWYDLANLPDPLTYHVRSPLMITFKTYLPHFQNSDDILVSNR